MVGAQTVGSNEYHLETNFPNIIFIAAKLAVLALAERGKAEGVCGSRLDRRKVIYGDAGSDCHWQ